MLKRATLATLSLAIVASMGVRAAETVSLAQLVHKVPANAAEDYRASLRALSAGDLEAAILRFEHALRADGENAAGHYDFGLLLLANGRTDEALAEFDRASLLDAHLAASRLRASYALLKLEKFGEAEAAARSALAISRGSIEAKLLLGWSLVQQRVYSEEALRNLDQAAREFPEARMAAAEALMHLGKLREAGEQVERYLATGDSSQKQLAESWRELLAID